MAKGSARITNAGAVGQVFMPEIKLSEKHKQGIWPGKISLQPDIENDRSSLKQLNKITSEDNLNQYFVKTDLTAPTRCIDGRIIEGWDNSKELQNRKLGPQTPGGTPATALIHRLIMMGEVGGPNISFEKDLKDIIKIFAEHKVYFGGHIDESNEKHPENTGCGAIDRLPEILAQMVHPKAFREIKALSQILLSDIYDDRIANELIGRLTLLQADSEEYLEYDEETGIYLYKQKALEVMRQNASKDSPIEKLVGSHKEKGLVINMVPLTTFDRDRFSFANNNEIQLFSYDAWRATKTAELIYGATGNAERHKLEYVICRTMYAVATTMVLTDGSLNLYIRSAVVD